MTFSTVTIEVSGVSAPLRCYIPDVCGQTPYVDNRPAVIIFPGGGYGFTYSGEAEPIALKYAADGICAFVLDYSCAPARFPIPQLQAFKAIRYVRENAKKFGVDEHNIATSGFSAGGHLCSCTGTLWNKFDEYFRQEGMDDVENTFYRPDKLILCYPVILSPLSPFCNVGSFRNLLGEKVEDEYLLNFLSTDKQIDELSSPSFIWHTSADNSVPPVNSHTFALALATKKIACEMHVYLNGGHGLCLGTSVTNDLAFTQPLEVSDWIYKAIRFAYAKT